MGLRMKRGGLHPDFAVLANDWLLIASYHPSYACLG